MKWHLMVSLRSATGYHIKTVPMSSKEICEQVSDAILKEYPERDFIIGPVLLPVEENAEYSVGAEKEVK